MSNLQSPSIDINEIEKFSQLADGWWDLSGKFKPLHKLNPLRVGYIRDNVEKIMGKGPNEKGSYFSLSPSILDIGCGGGLLSEPMAKLGAKVTAIDASEKNIKIASIHAQKSGLDINYICTSAEDMAASGKKFDVVLNMEVIEHVADVASFIEASGRMLNPGGLMFIATINRTLKSFAFAILGAEYILKWLPRGTHNWEKFLKPSEINTQLEKNGMKLKEIVGVVFNPIQSEWNLSKDIGVNYMILAVKDR